MSNKGLAALVAGAVALGGMVLLARKGGEAVVKPPPPEPGTELGGGLSIEIFDAATGQPVPHNSPATLVEGGSYYARVTATNRSTRGGTPVGAQLAVIVNGGEAPYFFTFVGTALDWAVLYAFNANEIKYWDVQFLVPLGAGGRSSSLNARIFDSSEQFLLRTASEVVTITSIAIAYAADLTIIIGA